MIKSLRNILLILILCPTAKGQTSIYDYIDLGTYAVGYQDTLLTDKRNTYEAFGYKGAKPQFVQVWHPVTRVNDAATYLSFSNFLELSAHKDLEAVQIALQGHIRESLIRDCIEENLLTYEANDFNPYSYTDILELMVKLKTRSIAQKMGGRSQFPVIVYHHGAQGSAMENYVMAEYFASRGFVFVAGNFHLPYENTMYGAVPYAYITEGAGEQSLMHLVTFAKTLSSSSFIFFIGHSWGAQMGLRALDQEPGIKGLVSLETTIEYKTEHERIKELWPEVYQKIAVEHARYPFPVMLCAATGKVQSFEFFKDIHAPTVVYAPTDGAFDHNAYLSIFYSRLFIEDERAKPDQEVLQSSLPLYKKHLELIHDFMERIMKKEIVEGKEVMRVGEW